MFRCRTGYKNGIVTIILNFSICTLIFKKNNTKKFFITLQKLGEDFLDSVTGENIPYYADAQKFNEGVEKTIGRIEAVLNGKEDPGKNHMMENMTNVINYKLSQVII